MRDYDPAAYWSTLHAAGDDLRVVGYPTLPLAFNAALYANSAAAVSRSLEAAHVSAAGRSVLDIGTGTGFWIDYWLRAGAAEVAGADLVPESVERLRSRFPGSRFAVADVSDGQPFPGRGYDVVSAMSVLLHITDEGRLRDAVASIAAQLAPDGFAVLLEPVAVRRWSIRGSEGEHNVVRTLAEWDRVLAAAGLEIAHVGAVTYLLSDPVDARTRIGFRLGRLWWRSFSWALQGRERAAAAVVPPLAALDRALAAAAGAGPSSKCLVLRRRD